MSPRPFLSPDARRPQPIDFTPGSSRPSDRSQGQAQPRGILRQPQTHWSSSVSQPPEFDQGYFRRPVQQQLSPDSRLSRHDRFGPLQSLPTMPPVSEIDTENDSVARACGRTPSQALRYQIESYRTHTPHRESEHAPTQWRPQAPRARTQDPRKLFAALDDLLHACDSASNDRFRLHDYLEWADVRAVQLRDRDDREERDRERVRFAQMRRNPHAEVDPKTVVLEAPLHDVILYASTPTVIEGTTYDIPIVVHACIDVLRRTAIYQQDLFVRLPNRRRCDELVDYFNYGPSFGEGFNLSGESTPDVCCLLSTFLMALPEPLIDPALFEPLFRWCVKPSCNRDDEKRNIEAKYDDDARMAAQRRGEQPKRREFAAKINPVRWTKKEERKNEELEKPQIAIAVILFKLLPSAHFSLLVYLLGFFTELPICPDNGMTLEESAKKFAERMMGGSKANSRKVMMWLLTRWSRILEGLFSESKAAYDEEVKKSKLSPPAATLHLTETLDRGDCNALHRSTTISSMQSYESSVTDDLSLVRDKSTRGLYRSMTSGYIVPYDPRFPVPAEDLNPHEDEKHHPAFAQTPLIQCSENAVESDKGSYVSESASNSAYSTDDESSPEIITSVQQQLSDKDEELTARTTQLAAETKRHKEAMQIIDDMTEEARVSAEQVRILRDDVKRLDDILKERARYAERQREEDRQMMADMKKMQKALETRLAENA